MNIARLIARRIADGSGQPLFAGRVTLADGWITRVERGDFKIENARCERFFDERFVLAPALIDAHGHSDLSILAMPLAEGKIAQGVATEIAGNCGLSAFPVGERNRAHLDGLYRQYHTELAWHDFATYRAAQRRCAARLDVLPLVGHNTLRAFVAGYEKQRLSMSEIEAMQNRLDAELHQGAPGLSSGLLYVPGCFADFAELKALLEVVARHDKIYTVHLRSEGDELENALRETLSAARAAGLRKLHLSHLKTARPENFHKLPRLLEALDARDLRVTGDVYCYDAAMTQLSVILPAPYDRMDDLAVMEYLRTESGFAAVLGALRAARPPEYWTRVGIISASPEYGFAAGKKLTEASRAVGLPPEELYLKIIRADAPSATGAFHTLSRENMEILASHPHVAPGSDESARHEAFDFGRSHPRGFGNMPEYFRLRRRQGAALATVIREMSALPADWFGLYDRGMIAPGRRAWLTAVEEAAYQAHADFAAPHRLSTGAEVIGA